jgi:anti-sigma B factor antagonist
MALLAFQMDVRSPAKGIRILDIQGSLTRSAEGALEAVYSTAGSDVKTIILNMSQAQSIDSLGAGLLIALQARTRKRRQRLLAYGLSATCMRAFQLTHLDEVVGLYANEAEALGSL